MIPYAVRRAREEAETLIEELSPAELAEARGAGGDGGTYYDRCETACVYDEASQTTVCGERCYSVRYDNHA